MMEGKHLAHGMARDKHATNGVELITLVTFYQLDL